MPGRSCAASSFLLSLTMSIMLCMLVVLLTALFNSGHLERTIFTQQSNCNKRPCDAKQLLMPSRAALSYLQSFLKEKFLDNRNKPPMKVSSSKTTYSNEGQSRVILQYFHKKTNGTFLEAGANDGFYLSNSLPLEVEYGWQGVLVEPIPDLYKLLEASGRSSALLQGCLSPYPYPYTAQMRLPPNLSVIYQGWPHLADPSVVGPPLFLADGNTGKNISAQCYPLFDVLMAANLTKLDALMLDVQGPELAVLKTLPWELVDIKLIMLENYHIHFWQKKEEWQLFTETLEYLKPRGYRFYKKVALDYIFVKDDASVPERTPELGYLIDGQPVRKRAE